MSLTIREQQAELAPLKWFPWVCANAMPDDRLFGLSVVAGAHGFCTGPSKTHFEDFNDLPDKDYLALVPTYYPIKPGFAGVELQLFLRALNYQEAPGAATPHGTPEDVMTYVPPIAARLAAYLHVLTKSPRSADELFQPGASALAQRNLSALLISYPVLMHPAGLYISARSFCIGKVSSLCVPTLSVPTSIAMASHARFPLAKDGFSTEQLTAFANNRCTRLGLTHRLGPQYGFQKKSDSKRSTFSLAVMTNQAKPDLIASLHEISKLTKASKAKNVLGVDKGVPFSYLTDVTAYGSYNLGFGNIYAQSFVDACGVLARKKDGQWQDRRDPSPEYLATFRELSAYRSESSSEVTKAMTDCILDRIFYFNADPYPADRVEQGVHKIAAGLVAAGVVKDLPAAGTWLLSLVHHQNLLPTTTIECATAFIRGLECYGAVVRSDSLDPIPGKTQDPYLLPGSDLANSPTPIWKEAVRIYGIEKSMRAVIQRSQSEVNDVGDEAAPAANPGFNGNLPGGRRRMRI